MFSTNVLSTNPELPAHIDPTDIKSNFEEAMLSRTQRTVNKWIFQASDEFEPKPLLQIKSIMIRSTSAFSVLGAPQHSWIAPGPEEELLLQTQTQHIHTPGCYEVPNPHHGAPRPPWLQKSQDSAHQHNSQVQQCLSHFCKHPPFGKVQETSDLWFYGLSEQCQVQKHF